MKFTAFLIGVGIGTTAALLFAPHSGQETRNMLSGKAKEGSRYLADKAQNVRDSATVAAAAAEEKLSQAVG